MSTLSSYPNQTERVAISDLVRELFNKVSEMINTQLQLTKTEIKVESRKMVGAVAFAGISLLLGTFFLLFFGVCLTLALWQVMNLVWASAITTVVYLLLAGVTLSLMFRELHKDSKEIEVE
jgi:uncharacterized membrane protein YqjE